MAYIVGQDRNQVNIVMVSLDELISADNPVCAIDAYVNSLDLKNLDLWNAQELIEGRRRICVLTY